MLYPCDFLEPAQNVAVNGLGFASPLQFLKGFVAIVSCSLNVCSPLACLVLLRSPEGLPKYSPGAHLEQFPAPGSEMLRNTRFGAFCTEVPEGLPKCSPGAHLEQFPAPDSKMLRKSHFGSFWTQVPDGLPKCSPGVYLEQFPAPGSKMIRNTRFGAFCV